MRRALHDLLARALPGTWWIRSFAWYTAHVRRRPHQLVGATKVGPQLYRLSFRDGSSLHIVSPRRVIRYLDPEGRAGILRDVHARYVVGEGPPPSTVIDVGANIGEFALAVLERSPQVQIMCVEADPVVLPALRANLAPHPNAVVEACAVGPERGTATFYSSWRDADSSLIEPLEASTAIVVDVVTLDELVERRGWSSVSLFKMDAEGAEPEVLAGAPSTLRITRSVAIDAGPERRGQTTLGPVAEVLTASGFSHRRNPVSDTVVLGVRDPSG